MKDLSAKEGLYAWKTGLVILCIFTFPLISTTSFSEEKIDKSKAHLLREISLLNDQTRKIDVVNKRSRKVLKESGNKYSYQTYLSFVYVHRTFLWCSDLSHWLFQTFDRKDNMNAHIYGRLRANRESVLNILDTLNKIYKKTNDVKLLNAIDIQEKNIRAALAELDKIMLFIKEIEKG